LNEDIDVKRKVIKVTVSSEAELEKVTEKIIEKSITEEIENISKHIKRNVIEEFKNTLGSSRFSFSEKQGDLTGDVVLKALEKMKIVRDGYKGGKMRWRMVIPDEGDERLKKGLIKALNNGTGIYGDSKQPIRPKNKKYMFIPGLKFASKYIAPVTKNVRNFRNYFPNSKATKMPKSRRVKNGENV